jgi:hypothetical protein
MTWLILAAAAAMLPQDRDPETVRRQLHEILGRSEFRRKMPSEFWANLRKRLKLDSDSSAPDVDEYAPSPCQVSSPGGAFSGGVMNVLFIIGFALLAAFLIAIAYHAWTRRGAARAPPPAPVAAAASSMPDPLTRDSQEWAFEADRLFKLGRIAEAIRALYLAALSHSHVRRWIDYHPSKPNWEHVRRFSGPAPARTNLSSLTSVFERKWYGRKPVEESEYQSTRDMAAAILRSGEAAA